MELLPIQQDLIASFPTLIYSQIVERSSLHHLDLSAHVKDEKILTEFLPWMSSGNASFDQLRIRLTKGELIIRNITSDHILLILCPTNQVVLLLEHLARLPLAASPTAKAPAKKTKPAASGTRKDTTDLLSGIFFAHKPRTLDCADFVWKKQEGETTFIGLISCSGRSADGRKTSELCREMLEQAFSKNDPGDLKPNVKKYYELLVEYDQQVPENRKVKSEIGILCLDPKLGAMQFISTGVCLLMMSEGGKQELQKTKRILKYESPEKYLYEYNCDIKELHKLYLYASGVAELFGGEDHRRLGHSGLAKIVQEESHFSERYYLEQLHFWVGDTLQSDNISIIGLQFT